MNKKELVKKIIIFSLGTIALVIFLLPAIDNFKTKNEYEKQKQEQNQLSKIFRGKK